MQSPVLLKANRQISLGPQALAGLTGTSLAGATTLGRASNWSGWQRMKWSDGIIDSMDRSLSKLREMVKDREAWRNAVNGVTKSWTWLTDWTMTMRRQWKMGSDAFSVQAWSSSLLKLWHHDLHFFFLLVSRWEGPGNGNVMSLSSRVNIPLAKALGTVLYNTCSFISGCPLVVMKRLSVPTLTLQMLVLLLKKAEPFKRR